MGPILPLRQRIPPLTPGEAGIASLQWPGECLRTESDALTRAWLAGHNPELRVGRTRFIRRERHGAWTVVVEVAAN